MKGEERQKFFRRFSTLLLALLWTVEQNGFFNRSAFFCLHDRGNFTKTTKERICLIFNEYFQELSSILDTFDSNGESYYTLRNPYFTTLKLKIPVFNATLTIFYTMLDVHQIMLI